MSLGGTGSRDWLTQRFTAVFLALYMVFLLGFIIKHTLHHGALSYDAWAGLFALPSMFIATVFALFCIAFHAWVGLWTIVTDYIKVTYLRYLLLGIFLMTLFSYVLWGILILWE